MPTKRLLRLLIVAELAFGLLYVVVYSFSEPPLSPEVRAHMEAQLESLTPSALVQMVVGIPLVIAALISRVGLFFFWRFARPLYLIVMVADLLLSPLLGAWVETGWGQMLEETAIVLSAIILTLVYWSPLRVLYETAQHHT